MVPRGGFEPPTQAFSVTCSFLEQNKEDTIYVSQSPKGSSSPLGKEKEYKSGI